MDLSFELNLIDFRIEFTKKIGELRNAAILLSSCTMLHLYNHQLNQISPKYKEKQVWLRMPNDLQLFYQQLCISPHNKLAKQLANSKSKGFQKMNALKLIYKPSNFDQLTLY